MSKLKSFLEDESGGFSSTRLALLLWVVGVLVMWIWKCIQQDELAVIDNSVLTLLGVLMTGKVVQRFGEKPEPPPAGKAGGGAPDKP